MERAPNEILHPLRLRELDATLTDPPPPPADPARLATAWEWREAPLWHLATVTPILLLLVWVNYTGRQIPNLPDALVARVVWPLFPPLGGSWLNLAESVRRILRRRALDGQQPTSAAEVMTWLAKQVVVLNADPTPFAWGGKRAARRHRLGSDTRRPIRRRLSRASHPLPIGTLHVT